MKQMELQTATVYSVRELSDEEKANIEDSFKKTTK